MCLETLMWKPLWCHEGTRTLVEIERNVMVINELM